MASASTVVYFDHSAAISGGEIALLNLVKQIDRSRYEPVVALFSDGPLHAKLAEAGIETHILPLSRHVADVRKDTLNRAGVAKGTLSPANVAFVFRLYRFVRRRRAAIVHTNSLKADVLGGLAGNIAGVPVVWHVRDRISEDYLPSAAVRLLRTLARHIPAYVVANSSATLQTVRLPQHKRGANIPSDIAIQRSAVVHDGLPRFGVRSRSAEAHAPLVGLVGRIAPWKGQHVFLEAAARVRERVPDARFQVIGAPLFGEHEYEARVRRQCSELGLDDAVEFTGFRDDVPDLIANLDILVHASTAPEPFGQVVLEGMIAAKPVVATNGGGVPEVMVDGETGVLVPMGDSAAMADAIVAILADPARAQAMGAAGRERALSNFMIEQTARKVEAVYDAVLNHLPRASWCWS